MNKKSSERGKSDAEVIAGILSGDHEKYSLLMRRYKSLVVAHTYSRVNHRETAEDLAQETFVRAFRSLPHLKNPEAFLGWLVQIATNVCIDYLRNKSRTVSLEVHGEKDSHGEILLEDPRERPVMESVAQRELRDRVLEAIDGLSEEYRLTLVLRHVHGLSCEAIAEALNVSLGTVTSRLSRAHRMLRERLGEIMG